MTIKDSGRAPSAADVRSFIDNSFLRIDDAFPKELAEEARAILWRETGCDPNDRATWTRPVIRLGGYASHPFSTAATTSRLRAAYDAIVGEGRWLPPGGLGTFPVRFPSSEDPGDAGWHIDASFGGDPADFMSWRANIASRGRALLMLFLFSDVADEDAPTRIRVGSHRDIARRLQPAGDDGLTLGELASSGFAESADRDVALATGAAGTVYLCHPFLVHAAQPHRGTRPRFMAQPPLLPAGPMWPDRQGDVLSPVERATAEAIGGG